jgi:cell division protein FtsB
VGVGQFGDVTIGLNENHWILTAIFGGGLSLAGLSMMAWHQKSWARQREEPGFNQWDLKRLKTRYRRRMQTSGMIVVLGVMLAVGDALIWSQGPLVATIYWIVVIAMGGWLLLLGVGDLLTVRVDSKLARDELQRIGQKRAELEAEVEEMRRGGSNGESKSNGRH